MLYPEPVEGCGKKLNSPLRNTKYNIKFHKGKTGYFKLLTMKKHFLSSAFVLALTTFSVIVYGQDIILKQAMKSGVYAQGQKINVTVFTEVPTGDTLHIRVFKNNNQLLVQKDILSVKDSLMIYEGAFREPCSVIVEARIKKMSASLGMLVDPGKLKPGAKRPGDFETYWKNVKKSLNEMPQEIKRAVLLLELGYL